MKSRGSYAIGCRLLLLSCLMSSQLAGQENVAIRFGGGYDSLSPEQQALVRDWHQEYASITGNRIDAKTGYDNLKVSVRTTFDAVTNALQQTKLTDAEGNSLGTALGLVKLVESVHGEVPHTRGDEQFRVYVRLQDDALRKLYQCVQFRRTADNGIYHIGYPINFRQQGGSPSIQFSVTRTGLRADIDVDYRSSGGPQALVNGHLTSANSDIRAGSNYARHIGRWEGLGNWWQSLFGFTSVIPKADMEALSSTYRKPAINDAQPVEVAIHDFFQSWLMAKKPELSLSYVSVKANACIAGFSGESATQSLIRLRLLEHMRKANKQVGDTRDLDEALHAVVILGPAAQPIQQPYGKLFSVANITDSTAREIDCRLTQGMSLAEDLPSATNRLGDYFSSSTVIRGPDSRTGGQLLYMVWHKEEGTWKIVGWHLVNPYATSNGPKLADAEKPESSEAANMVADPGLVASTDQLLTTWLVKKDIPDTLKLVSAEARTCANLEGQKSKSGKKLTQAGWFEQVAGEMPKSATLSGAIQRAAVSHPQMQEVSHPEQNAYLLVRISDDIASMYDCAGRSAGVKPGPTTAMGKAFYTLNVYQAIFEPQHDKGDRGTVVLTLARRQNRWMIIAYDVVTY